MTKYPARYEKEEKFYYCKFIDFPDASTQGVTLEELRANAQDALSLAINFYIDHKYAIPEPSKVESDDILWVEPYPQTRQRMGHRPDCNCPICRNLRGERKVTKKMANFRLNTELLKVLDEFSEKKELPKTVIVETALKEYLEKNS